MLAFVPMVKTSAGAARDGVARLLCTSLATVALPIGPI
jgi:hypothetical protein